MTGYITSVVFKSRVLLCVIIISSFYTRLFWSLHCFVPLLYTITFSLNINFSEQMCVMLCLWTTLDTGMNGSQPVVLCARTAPLPVAHRIASAVFCSSVFGLLLLARWVSLRRKHISNIYYMLELYIYCGLYLKHACLFDSRSGVSQTVIYVKDNVTGVTPMAGEYIFVWMRPVLFY